MAEPIPNGANGRDRRGRFQPGNPGGPGNPQLQRAAEVFRAVQRAVTPEDIAAVIRKLHAMALDGDVSAARIFLDRVIGRPAQAIDLAISGEDSGQDARLQAAAGLRAMTREERHELRGLLRRAQDLTLRAEQRMLARCEDNSP